MGMKIHFEDQGVLRKLNSITKYPSITTFHEMGERGRLSDRVAVDFGGGDVSVTEKVDGTNSRIVAFPGEQRPTYLIGSREEWLTAGGDLICNPAQQIVEAVRGHAQALVQELVAQGRTSEMVVLWGETYGGKVTAASKEYSSDGRLGFRAFDAMSIPYDLLGDMLGGDLDQIASWRDDGAQPFMHQKGLSRMAAWARAQTVPLLTVGPPPPSDVAPAFDWLCSTLGYVDGHGITRASLDHEGTTNARPEGVVVRSVAGDLEGDRRIAKLRIEDYQRTLGGRFKGKGTAV